jgi:hypothetical protein
MGKLELSELCNEIGKDTVSGCSFLDSICSGSSTHLATQDVEKVFSGNTTTTHCSKQARLIEELQC